MSRVLNSKGEPRQWSTSGLQEQYRGTYNYPRYYRKRLFFLWEMVKGSGPLKVKNRELYDTDPQNSTVHVKE